MPLICNEMLFRCKTSLDAGPLSHSIKQFSKFYYLISRPKQSVICWQEMLDFLCRQVVLLLQVMSVVKVMKILKNKKLVHNSIYEDFENNIHRVTVAKWLEYCAPQQGVAGSNPLGMPSSNSVHLVKLGASQTL